MPLEHPAAGGEAQPIQLQWRICELALLRMIEDFSIARDGRALLTLARVAGEGRFIVGDRAEVHQPPSTEDAPGWAGPSTVLPVDPARGKVAARCRQAKMVCRLRRRTNPHRRRL
eukprot:2344485-Pyramimonas_sp.AAC.1